MKKRAIILNDTRTSSHPGCHLVMTQIEKKCLDFGLEILRSFKTTPSLIEDLDKMAPRSDVIIINGEGSMHHDRPTAELLCKATERVVQHGKPVYLINTVWEKNSSINRMLPLLSGVFSRESLSSQSLAAHGCSNLIVPDLTFCCDSKFVFPKSESKLNSNVIVIDNVRVDASMQLANFARENRYPFYRMSPRPSLRNVSSILQWAKLFALGGINSQLKTSRLNVFNEANIVVTGRFHGACLAILTGRPFIAISSNTHKIEGLIRDSGLGSGAVILNGDEFLKNPSFAINKALNDLACAMEDKDWLPDYKFRCNRYIAEARVAADAMFQKICC